MQRSLLISQLRSALYQAESPSNDTIEFTLGNTDLCFEVSDETNAYDTDCACDDLGSQCAACDDEE